MDFGFGFGTTSVRKHRRTLKNGKSTTVRKHTRGVKKRSPNMRVKNKISKIVLKNNKFGYLRSAENPEGKKQEVWIPSIPGTDSKGNFIPRGQYPVYTSKTYAGKVKYLGMVKASTPESAVKKLARAGYRKAEILD